MCFFASLDKSPTFILWNVSVSPELTDFSNFPPSGSRPDGTSTDITKASDVFMISMAVDSGSRIFPRTPVPNIPSIIISGFSINLRSRAFESLT